MVRVVVLKQKKTTIKKKICKYGLTAWAVLSTVIPTTVLQVPVVPRNTATSSPKSAGVLQNGACLLLQNRRAHCTVSRFYLPKSPICQIQKNPALRYSVSNHLPPSPGQSVQQGTVCVHQVSLSTSVRNITTVHAVVLLHVCSIKTDTITVKYIKAFLRSLPVTCTESHVQM